MVRPHLFLLFATSLAAGDAIDLLAKARAAYERNQQIEVHWNWTRTESRRVVDKNGKPLQDLPEVTIESTVRSDGRRCEAVLAWGDGVEAYNLRADSDARCEATEPVRSSRFAITELLKSRKAKVTSQSSKGITLAIEPDKDQLASADERVRCSASIRATVMLDPATFFPRRIDGRVIEAGCDRQQDAPPTYYGETAYRGTVRTLFHQGAIFRLEFELQSDKFNKAERSYWVQTLQHYDTPRWHPAGMFFYWGRSVVIESMARGQRMVEDFKLVAQEFGSESRIVP